MKYDTNLVSFKIKPFYPTNPPCKHSKNISVSINSKWKDENNVEYRKWSQHISSQEMSDSEAKILSWVYYLNWNILLILLGEFLLNKDSESTGNHERYDQHSNIGIRNSKLGIRSDDQRPQREHPSRNRSYI